jgi:hypothetical protein
LVRSWVERKQRLHCGPAYQGVVSLDGSLSVNRLNAPQADIETRLANPHLLRRTIE